jgi:hypothetical protein
MACGAPGHGTIRLHELAIPRSIESTTAALIAGYVPKSSLFTMSTRAPGGNPAAHSIEPGAWPARARRHAHPCLSVHPAPRSPTRHRSWSRA